MGGLVGGRRLGLRAMVTRTENYYGGDRGYLRRRQQRQSHRWRRENRRQRVRLRRGRWRGCWVFLNEWRDLIAVLKMLGSRRVSGLIFQRGQRTLEIYFVKEAVNGDTVVTSLCPGSVSQGIHSIRALSLSEVRAPFERQAKPP